MKEFDNEGRYTIEFIKKELKKCGFSDFEISIHLIRYLNEHKKEVI